MKTPVRTIQMASERGCAIGRGFGMNVVGSSVVDSGVIG